VYHTTTYQLIHDNFFIDLGYHTKQQPKMPFRKL